MLFRDLKVGYPVFIFDRQEYSAVDGNVVGITPSHYDIHYTPTDLVVDVTIEICGKNLTFTVKDNVDVAYTETKSICTDKETRLREVEAMKSQKETGIKQIESAIGQLDQLKTEYTKCVSLAVELNPVLKRETETENRLTKMEESMAEISLLMKQFLTNKRTNNG